MAAYTLSRAPDEYALTFEEEDMYYSAVGKESDLRERYRLPPAYLQGLGVRPPPLPQVPLVVLINSRSGGHAGPQLTSALRRAIGHSQVLDLGNTPPNEALETIWKNFGEQAAVNREAYQLRERLRLIAAGGDGTVAWVLQSIARSNIKPQPAVSVIPLGTGNDLSRSFGWGGMFNAKSIKNHNALWKTLNSVAEGVGMPLDMWRLQLKAPNASYFDTKRPYAFAPHDGDTKTATSYEAFSWNYVSIGMDARAAHGFHTLRDSKPALAFSRTANQAWYVYYGCSSGWFCGAGPLNNEVRLELLGADGKWKETNVPSSVRALIFLNLQSYGGGRDIWKHDKSAEAKGYKAPAPFDGLLEVVGFKDAYSAGAVMSGMGHAVRLGQASGARVHICSEKATAKGKDTVYMQLDGEPWKQLVPSGNPSGGNELLVELTLAGKSNMLAVKGSEMAKKWLEASGGVPAAVWEGVATTPAKTSPATAVAAQAPQEDYGSGTAVPVEGNAASRPAKDTTAAAAASAPQEQSGHAAVPSADIGQELSNNGPPQAGSRPVATTLPSGVQANAPHGPG